MASLPDGIRAEDLGGGRYAVTVCPGQTVPAAVVNAAIAEMRRIEEALRTGAEHQRNEPKGGR